MEPALAITRGAVLTTRKRIPVTDDGSQAVTARTVAKKLLAGHWRVKGLSPMASFHGVNQPFLPLLCTLHRVATDRTLCRGGVTGFAHATGRRVSTIAHKLDPKQPELLPNLRDLLDLLAYLTPEGRRVVLDALHSTLGDSFVVHVDDSATAPPMLACLAELLHGAADLSNFAAPHVEQGQSLPVSESAERLGLKVLRAALGFWMRARVSKHGLPAPMKGVIYG